MHLLVADVVWLSELTWPLLQAPAPAEGSPLQAAVQSPWIWVGVAVVGVVLIALALALLRRRRKTTPATAADRQVLPMDALPAGGPPDDGPLVEFYNIPMRVCLVVLAPRGRNENVVVQRGGLAQIMDQIVDGLGAATEPHGTILKLWPAQLSAEGFAHAFFHRANLPGQHGKGTPLVAVAGPCEINGAKLLVGLVLRSAGPNNLAQSTVDSEYAWRDVLRVRARA